jgi:hypothetical protein
MMEYAQTGLAGCLTGIVEEKHKHFEDIGIEGMTVLKWILKEHDRRMCIGFIWLSTGGQWQAVLCVVVGIWVT